MDAQLQKIKGTLLQRKEEKAKLMAQTFAKIYSRLHLINKEKEGKKKTVLENTELLQAKLEYGNVINIEFSMTEP